MNRTITRRGFLRTLGRSAAAVAATGILPAARRAAAARKRKGRPNIIVFMPDDIGWEAHGCYGSAAYKTPVIDKLAAGGVRFENCHAQPLCTPSRVKIMTGRYNCRNYVRFGLLDKGERTFGNILRDAGYATGIAGKWQLGGDGETVRHFGFDEHCLWHIIGRSGRYWKPLLVHNGKQVQHEATEYGPDLICDFALDFMERHADEPFFLYYPMVLTHWPFDPTPDSEPGGSRKKHVAYKGSKGGEEYFPDMVAYMDKIVGRVVDKLDKLGLREDTLILFTGDNGTARIKGKMKDGSLAGGSKGSMTDRGTRVALVANWPGSVPGGRVTDALVDFSDFLPTVCEAAGANVPDEPTVDGVSFLPVLRGEKRAVREWIFCDYNPRPPRQPKNPETREKALQKVRKKRKNHQVGRWARTERFKLYGTGDLYDVPNDRDERKPIPPGKGTPEAEAARTKLQAVLDSMPPFRPFQTRPGKA